MHEQREKLPKAKHKCTVCGLSVVYIKEHMKLHTEEKIPCPECNAVVRDLKEHIANVHTLDKDKKFQCQDCGKGFLHQHKLEKHKMNVHLKQRPFQCRYGCDMAYNDKSNRSAHERKKHGKLFNEPT